MNKKKNKFEPGIYNYCDRWCERCGRQDKCLLYFKTQKERNKMLARGEDPDDIKNVLKTVGDSFEETFALVTKYCAENNIDMVMSKEEEKEYNKKEKAIDPEHERLVKLSYTFIKFQHDWFETTPPLDIDEYHEAYQVLSWHGTLIYPKISRALSSKNEYLYEKTDLFSLEDAEKSAMVALRSALLLKKSLEIMDSYVLDPRIGEMIELLVQIIKGLNDLLKEIRHLYARA